MIPRQEIPHDNRLALVVILDAANMRGVFQDASNAQVPDDTASKHENSELQVRNCKIEWIKYKPDMSHNGDVMLWPGRRPPAEAGWTPTETGLVVYGRTYADEAGAQAYRVMEQLWHSAARADGRLRMATPLGYDAEHHLLWQLGLPGPTLLEQDMHSSQFLTLLGKAAALIATLHGSPVTCSRSKHVNDVLATFQERLRLFLSCPTSVPGTPEGLSGALARPGDTHRDTTAYHPARRPPSREFSCA